LIALLLFACRALLNRRGEGRELGLRWLVLLPVALFSLAAQHDALANREVRWDASQTLVSQGVAPNEIAASFEWGGEYLFNAEGERIRASGAFSDVVWLPLYLFDPKYYVSDVPIKGYDVVRTVHYTSWLEFGQGHAVYVQKRRQ
jgi:hypothetical protein